MTDPALRETPLHDEHEALSARMIGFAGWRMPIQYRGVIYEHLAVRERVGLFDVSHMGEATVRGPGALDFLQRVTCNNVAKLRPGRAQYTALTTPAGTFVDDTLIYQRGDADYLLVLNAANTRKDLEWLAGHSQGFDVELRDVSDHFALIAVQGPRALATLGPLVQAAVDTLRYYHHLTTEVCRATCLVSRTGYTGEDGFEIYAPADCAGEIWRALLESGRPHDITPAGLAARDTLRLEAKMALYGNDIDETTTVLEADLGWIVKLEKGDFIGRDVLARQKEQGVDRKLVGFEVRGRAIARPGYAVHHDGREVGRVTSGTHAPFLKKSIGLAYLPIELSEAGNAVEIAVRDRREPAKIVPTPFYRRPR